MRQSPLSPVLLVAVVALMGLGCSSFRHDRGVAQSLSAPSTPVEGLWVGDWKDAERPEHGGEVEAVLTRTGDQLYRFATRSEWWGVFRSAYDTTLVITPTASGKHLVRGGKSLWMFGDYSVTGTADATTMDLVYSVGKHSGRMVLRRAPAGTAAQAFQTPPARGDALRENF